MKLLFSIIIILAIPPISSNWRKNEDPSKDVRVGLVMDLVEQLHTTYNLVFINTLEDEDIVHAAIVATDITFSCTLLEYYYFTKDMIKELEEVQLKDNIPSLYTVLQPNSNPKYDLEEVIKIVKLTDYRAQVVIIYGTENYQKPSYFYDSWFYYKQENVNVYDVYILNPISEQSSIHALYELCQFCHSGKDEIKLMAKWDANKKFIGTIKFSRSFKGSFYNTSLSMGVDFSQHGIYVTGIDGAGNALMDGILYHNSMDLARLLNLKWNFKNVTKSSFLYAGNIVFGGLYFDVLKHNIDIMGGYTIQPFYSPTVHFSSATYYRKGQDIISIEPIRGLEWFALFTPFVWVTWLLLCIAIPAVGVTLYILRKYGPTAGVSLSNCMWEVVVIICWDSIQVRNPSYTVCFLLCCYMPMVMSIVTFYMDKYTCALTAPEYTPLPIETYEMLNTSNKEILSPTILIYNKWNIITRLKTSIKDIEKRIETLDSNDDEDPSFLIFNKMQEEPDKYVFLYQYGFLERYLYEFTKERYRKFYKSKESLSDVLDIYETFIYLPTFPFKEHFNRKIMLLQAMHIPTLNEKRANTSAKVAWDRYTNRKQSQPYIKLVHMGGCFILLATGYILAALVHIITLLKVKLLSYIWMRAMAILLVELHAGLTHMTLPMDGGTEAIKDDTMEVTEV